MAYTYFNTLGNKAYYDFNANGPQAGWGLLNTGPFINWQFYSYWSGNECEGYLEDGQVIRSWSFCYAGPSWSPTSNGHQYNDGKGLPLYAWAVRDGDVVPIPGAIWLLGSGLIGVIGIRMKFRKLAKVNSLNNKGGVFE
jgi:hypothetical protein